MFAEIRPVSPRSNHALLLFTSEFQTLISHLYSGEAWQTLPVQVEPVHGIRMGTDEPYLLSGATEKNTMSPWRHSCQNAEAQSNREGTSHRPTLRASFTAHVKNTTHSHKVQRKTRCSKDTGLPITF